MTGPLRIRYALLAAAIAWGGSPALAQGIAARSVNERLDALKEVEMRGLEQRDSTRERARDMADAYRKRFKHGGDRDILTRFTDGELRMLFRAATVTAFYTIDGRHVNEMASVLDVMESKNIATEDDYVDMHQALVSVRQFGLARTLAREHPSTEYEFLPEIRGAAPAIRGPRVWRLAIDGRTLEERVVDLTDESGILVVAHPLCNPSSRAVHDIYSDIEMRQVFLRNARWLMPQRRLDIDAVRRWNEDYPQAPLHLVVDRDEWAAIDDWGRTPVIFVLHEGSVVEKVVGWPRGGRWEELRAALQRGGFLENAIEVAGDEAEKPKDSLPED